MKRFGPLIISLFVAVTAWAGDVGYTVPEEIGYGSLVLYEVAQPVSEIWLNQDTRELVFRDADGKEIVLNDILQRCLEFLRDGDANYLENIPTCTTLLYVPPYRTLKNDAEDEVSKAEIAKGRLERETALRREIEKAIRILKGEK